jgi:hypothetical protein
MYGQGNMDGFLEGFMGMIGEIEKQKMRREYGITNEGGFDGVKQCKIPHEFYHIFNRDKYYFCLDKNNLTHVYTLGGIFLFKGNHIKYLKEGMFLVQEIDEKKKLDNLGYALFSNEHCLTEYIYTPHGLSNSFNDCGFIQLNLVDEFMASHIIDKQGRVAYKHEGLGSPYIYGIICSTDKGYLNLLTNEYICKKGYSSTLSTKECMFIKLSDNCVYQINKYNGAVLIHGEDYKEVERKRKEDAEARAKDNERIRMANNEIDDKFAKEYKKWNNLGRNDKCLCGSNKKFKECCKNTWLDRLKAKHKEEQKGVK